MRMDTYSASSQVRIMGLTTDTSNALHVTLNGLVSLVSQTLLAKMTLCSDGRSSKATELKLNLGLYRQQRGGGFPYFRAASIK